VFVVEGSSLQRFGASDGVGWNVWYPLEASRVPKEKNVRSYQPTMAGNQNANARL
jgi:hypothetical protein